MTFEKNCDKDFLTIYHVLQTVTKVTKITFFKNCSGRHFLLFLLSIGNSIFTNKQNTQTTSSNYV